MSEQEDMNLLIKIQSSQVSHSVLQGTSPLPATRKLTSQDLGGVLVLFSRAEMFSAAVFLPVRARGQMEQVLTGEM